MSLRSPYPDVQIPDVSLTEFLFADGFGDRADAPAIVDGTTGDQLTYTEFHGLVEKIAGGLAARGIGTGDVVALFAPNLPQWAALFHGILRANGIVTSANSMYTGGELAHQLKDSGAKMVITVSPFLDRAVAGAKEAGLSEDVVLTIDATEGHDSLRDLVGSGAPAPELTTTATDTAVLPYSSGTTGLAKGVVLTHRNLVANLLQIQAMGDVTSETKIMAFLPFFHIYGMTVMMNQGLHARAALPRILDNVENALVVAIYRHAAVIRIRGRIGVQRGHRRVDALEKVIETLARHEEMVGRQASLTAVERLGHRQTLRGVIHVGVFADDDRALTAEFQRHGHQVGRRRSHDLRTDPRAAGEHQVIEGQRRKRLVDLQTAADRR